MYAKKEIRKIAEDLAEELRELPDGYRVTSAMFLEECGYDAEEFGFGGLFDFHNELLRAAKAKRITLDMSEHDGKDEGLPFNLDFIVRNRRAQIKCPYCGGTNTARYLYGLPAWDPEMQEKLDSGKWVLGGCCISTAEVNGKPVRLGPARRCNNCKKDFGTPPLLIKGDAAEDYRDLVESVTFSDGGFFLGQMTISVTKNDKGAFVTASGFGSKTGFPKDEQISPLRWKRLVDDLYTKLYLHEWKKRYGPPKGWVVMDGEQWSLEIELSGGRRRTWTGDNGFPACWKELKALFRPFVRPVRPPIADGPHKK